MAVSAARLSPNVPERSRTHRLLLLAVTIAGSVPLYWIALTELAGLVMKDEGYTHIVLVPFISAWFLWNGRDDLLRESNRKSRKPGLAVIGLGAAMYAGGWILFRSMNPAHLAVWMLSLVCLWIGGSVLAFGSRAARNAAFPLAFLLFLVPLPQTWLQFLVGTLQHASAEITYLGFRVIGVPVYREGYVLTLPHLSIEVASECSGIRSSISLLLTTIITAHIALTSKINKVLLIAVAVPIAIIKNALRILTLSLLAVYVDRSFLTGKLHQRGGFVFFLIALSLIFGMTKLLRHFEDRRRAVQSQSLASTTSA